MEHCSRITWQLWRPGAKTMDNGICSGGTGQIRRIRGTFLFRDDFNRADRWVVHARRKIEFDLALRRGSMWANVFTKGSLAALRKISKSFNNIDPLHDTSNTRLPTPPELPFRIPNQRSRKYSRKVYFSPAATGMM
jgi:hypothetical protein